MTVEYLGGRGRSIIDGPVKDCGVNDEAYWGIGHPFPKHCIFGVQMRLDLFFHLDVKYLLLSLCLTVQKPCQEHFGPQLVCL